MNEILKNIILIIFPLILLIFICISGNLERSFKSDNKEIKKLIKKQKESLKILEKRELSKLDKKLTRNIHYDEKIFICKVCHTKEYENWEHSKFKHCVYCGKIMIKISISEYNIIKKKEDKELAKLKAKYTFL